MNIILFLVDKDGITDLDTDVVQLRKQIRKYLVVNKTDNTKLLESFSRVLQSRNWEYYPIFQ